MWLLNSDFTELRSFTGADAVRSGATYAILSHVWQGNQERTFQDVQDLFHKRARNLPRDEQVFDKIRSCCLLAKKHGYDWVWIDTCCIDKTNSSELSEAINSMFEWYAKADVCYAFLQDIAADQDITESRWFERGWTLQELIMPASLLFVANSWSALGTKQDFANIVQEKTHVSSGILSNALGTEEASISQRMSWASSRQTTRREDRAYCLMGLFGVNMPTLYGEGDKAFYRLQEEILKTSTDHTIFAWGEHVPLGHLLDSAIRSPVDDPSKYYCSKHHLLADDVSRFTKASQHYRPITDSEAVNTAIRACTGSNLLFMTEVRFVLPLISSTQTNSVLFIRNKSRI